jgi:hypothetical protein
MKKSMVKILFILFAVCSCCFIMPRQLITPGPESFQTKPEAKEHWKDMISREFKIEARGGMHSQASYWFSIGFKQMVCTVTTCYWFLALLWFYKTRSFLSIEPYNSVRSLSVSFFIEKEPHSSQE